MLCSLYITQRKPPSEEAAPERPPQQHDPLRCMSNTSSLTYSPYCHEPDTFLAVHSPCICTLRSSQVILVNPVQEQWCSVSIKLSGSGRAVERWEAALLLLPTTAATAAAAESAAVRREPPSFQRKRESQTLIIPQRDHVIMLFRPTAVLVPVISGYFLPNRWVTGLSDAITCFTPGCLFLMPRVWFSHVISSHFLPSSPSPSPDSSGGGGRGKERVRQRLRIVLSKKVTW